MFRAQHAIVSLFVGSAIAVVGGGCSDDTKAIPQVIFTGQIQTAAGKDCRDSGDLFNVGTFGNPNATPPIASVPISDGAAAGQGTASITCSVTPAGTNLFNVSGEIDLTGATGGLFQIDGQFSTTGDQTNIHVRASARRSSNSYDETDRACIVRYTEANMGVAAGRVWGSLSCPNAVNTSDPNRACDLEAEFRFENCAQ